MALLNRRVVRLLACPEHSKGDMNRPPISDMLDGRWESGFILTVSLGASKKLGHR